MAVQLDETDRGQKVSAIESACHEPNVIKLVELANSNGGLLNDELRSLAWPILLGCTSSVEFGMSESTKWQDLPSHQDEEQVQRDVDRAFVFYANNASDKVMEERKRQLFDLIAATLRTHPALCYFQGYHDIVQVMMLVLGSQKAYPAVETLSLIRIRDYMLPSLTPALKHLQLIPAILRAADAQLATHLSMPHPNYALPSALTLYAHEIQEYGDIARLFDFLLANEPVMSIYFFAAIILSRRDSLLEIPFEEQDMLFFTLQKLPQPLKLDVLIQEAHRLFDQYRPDRLPGRVWQRLSSHSVLRTSRDITAPHSLASAEELFRKQAREVRWEEQKRKAILTAFKHRWSIATVSLTIAVGVFSVWLRKSGNDRGLLSFVLAGFRTLRNR